LAALHAPIVAIIAAVVNFLVIFIPPEKRAERSLVP
jgi:hypothetical protein